MKAKNPINHRFPRRSADEWRSIIQGYSSSDLTVDDFCKQQSVSKTQFVKWRNRFNEPLQHPTKNNTDFIQIDNNVVSQFPIEQ